MVAPVVIAALISAAASAGGGLLSSQSKNKEIALNQRALQQQQQSAREQMKLATATQTDPYGNRLIYTPGIGWHYDLTEQQQGLNAAARGEQLKALTEDATRDRQARERSEGRAMEGEQDWYRTLNEIRYGAKPNEASSIADLTRLGILGYERGAREGSNNIGRQAIRGLANPNVLSTLQRQTQEDLGGRLEEAILKGRSAGKQEYRADLQSRNQDLSGWLERFGNIASGQKQGGNVAMPNASGGLGSPDMNGIIQALQNASSGRTSAMNTLASSTGQGGLGSTLASLAPAIMQIGKYYQGQADATNAADPSSWSVSTTPDQRWAMQNDVYGQPYSWADILEDEEERTIGNEFGG